MGTTFNLICVELAYNWRVTGVLIGMIIYSLFLIIPTMFWLKCKEKAILIGLILLYLLSPFFIRKMGFEIENMLADENTSYGMFGFCGTRIDWYITFLGPIILPIALSLILSFFLKKHKMKKKAKEDNKVDPAINPSN